MTNKKCLAEVSRELPSREPSRARRKPGKAGMSARKGPIPASPGGSDAEVEAGAGKR